MMIMINIPDEVVEKELYSDYFGCSSPILDETIRRGMFLPAKATNGDVAKSIFGIGSNELHYKVRTPKWWNSPYKKEEYNDKK